MRAARCLLITALGLLGFFVLPSAAWAHEDEAEEGYLLVQQALGHLAHDASHEGIELAMEKLGDAVATEDQEGVEIADVELAMTALEDGDVDSARDLLQGSIEEALHDVPPATGSQTGTTVVHPTLPGRSGMDGQDWGFLAASVVVLLLGGLLAVRYRPPESIGELRRTLARPGVGDATTTIDRDGGGRS